MTLINWLSLVAVCSLGAMSPGPSLAVVIKHTVNGSRLHGVATAWAHALGIGLYACLTVFGLAVLLTRHPALFQLVTWAGAGYLAWLGVKSLRAGRYKPDPKAASATAGGLADAARDGAMISVLNPKIALFFIALFSQFVSVDSSTPERWLMAATAFMIDGSWYSIVAIVLSQAAILARFRANGHWVDRVCGVLFIAVAARIVLV